ncbi:MAG: FHA domain-containing protein [Chloroflexi bacterium]|nr:FHA domain-containing protein [Chloroflexota bacterium]
MTDTQYQLIVRKGPKVGEIFLLETASFTLGRDPVSDVVLNDPEVSRQHARFSQTETGYQVQDLGSTNGTFVNGERLESEAADLEPGFTVSMGSGVTLMYEAVSPAANLAATMVDPGGLGMMDELDDALNDEEAAVPDLSQILDEDPLPPAGWEPDPAPPFPPSPPPAAAPPLIPTPQDDEAAKKKRRNTIIIAIVAIILLCCCGFVAYMWFFGGDLLLEALGAV